MSLLWSQENPSLDVFPKPNHLFKKDYKLECIDPKHPSYICVCTIVQVKGARLRMHFDGWSESYDFWTNWDSPFIFPMGWCEKNGQVLHPPRSELIMYYLLNCSVRSRLFEYRERRTSRATEKKKLKVSFLGFLFLSFAFLLQPSCWQLLQCTFIMLRALRLQRTKVKWRAKGKLCELSYLGLLFQSFTRLFRSSSF